MSDTTSKICPLKYIGKTNVFKTLIWSKPAYLFTLFWSKPAYVFTLFWSSDLQIFRVHADRKMSVFNSQFQVYCISKKSCYLKVVSLFVLGTQDVCQKSKIIPQIKISPSCWPESCRSASEEEYWLVASSSIAKKNIYVFPKLDTFF